MRFGSDNSCNVNWWPVAVMSPKAPAATEAVSDTQ